MTDENANLVLRHLVELHNEIATLQRRLDDGLLQINLRLGAIDQHLVSQDMRAITYHDRLIAIEERLKHIESRLELRNA